MLVRLFESAAELVAVVRERAPILSERERDELYLLARYFRMSAHEARNVRPAWEIDMLLEGLVAELTTEEAG